MTDERELLRRTAELAADFLETLDERPVFPLTPVEELGTALEGPLPEGPTEPLEVVEALAREVESGIVRPPARGTSDSSPAERYPRRLPPTG